MTSTTHQMDTTHDMGGMTRQASVDVAATRVAVAVSGYTSVAV